MSFLDPAICQDWREVSLEIQGIRIHAVEAGPEDGPLVVMLHGFPEFWYGWIHQIGPLAAAGFRVLVPDQRGYNLSDKPRKLRDYSLDVLTRDVMELLDTVGRQRARIVAHDWGGAVGWMAAIKFPERVERLAVLNLPHPLVMRWHMFTNPRQIRRSWYIFFFQLPWLPEWLMARRDYDKLGKILRTTCRKGTFSEQDLAHYRRAWRQPGALHAMIQWYRAALQRPPKRPLNARVEIPTRILWGTQDVALGREMVPPSAALCDTVDVFYLEQAGHWLQHEEPDRVQQLLLDFLGSP